MELPKLVLKCLFAPHRAYHAAARHWHRGAGLLRPVAHIRHHSVVRVAARGLAGAQGACRYVPMVAGVAAGVTLLPASAMPPATAPAPALHAAAAPAGASAPGGGDSAGGGAFPSAGVAGSGLGAGGAAPLPGSCSRVPPTVISPVKHGSIHDSPSPGPADCLPQDRLPQHDIVPSSIVPPSVVPPSIVPPDIVPPDVVPPDIVSPPPVTVSDSPPPPPPTPVPEAPSVALFLPVLALLAWARQMRRAGGG